MYASDLQTIAKQEQIWLTVMFGERYLSRYCLQVSALCKVLGNYCSYLMLSS